MAEERAAKPITDELSAVTAEDVGVLYSSELRVPDDEILQARGGDLRVYDKVLRDEQVQSCFRQLRTAIISKEYKVDPGGERPIDIEAAEDLRLNIERIGFDQVTRKMLMGVWYGYSPGECMFGVDAGKVTLDRILVRKARRFRFDRDGGLRLVRKLSGSGELMPEQKFWLFRADQDDDDEPYPLGLGHYCYWPVWFKRNALRFWALWSEKFAAPTAVGKLPPGAKAEERSKLLRILEAIIRGGKIVIPSNVAVDLLEALQRAGDDYERFCKYLDGAIAKIILSQTMTTDDGSSRAQAAVHSDVKVDVVKSYADLHCESFNRGPAHWLTEWNYPGAAIPRVWRDCSEGEDLGQRSKVDRDLYEIGYRPNQQRIVDVYGQGYEPVTTATAGTQVTAPPNPPDGEQTQFAEGEGELDSEGGIEALIAGDGWERLIGPDVRAIERVVAGAKTLDDAKRLLTEYYAQEPEALTESLARVMFAARIGGDAGAELADDD